MIKKVTASLLAIVMCFSLLIPVSATFQNANYDDEQILLNGEIYTKVAEFGNIYESNGKYVEKFITINESENARISYEEHFLPVRKNKLSFSDEQAITEFMNRTDVPSEAMDSFMHKYEIYLSADEEIAVPTLEFFEPDENELKSHRANPDTIYHHTYNGYPMMIYEYSYKNISSEWISVAEGRRTKEIINDIKTIAFETEGLTIGVLSAVKSGASLLSAFLDLIGGSIIALTPHASDHFRVRFSYDQVERYTMTDRGASGWQTGLITYKIDLEKIENDVYIQSSGESAKVIETYYYETLRSEHFYDSLPTAFNNHLEPINETITYYAAGQTFEFMS